MPLRKSWGGRWHGVFGRWSMGTRHDEQLILPGGPYLVSIRRQRTHDVGSKYPRRYIGNNLCRVVLRQAGGNHANQPVTTQSVILTHTAGSSRQPKTAWVRLLILGRPLNRDDIHADAAVLTARALLTQTPVRTARPRGSRCHAGKKTARAVFTLTVN